MLTSTYLSSLSHLSEKSLQTKSYALSLLEDFTGGYVVDAVEFSQFLKEKGLSNSTIRMVLEEVQRFFLWLSERGYIARLERKKEAFRVLRTNKRKSAFTDGELKVIFDYMKSQAHPIFYIFSLVLLHSGIRLSSALALRSEDLEVKRFRLSTEDFEVVEKELLLLNVRHSKYGKTYQAGMPLLSEEEKETLKRFFSQRKDKDLWQYGWKFPKTVKTVRLNKDTVHKFYQKLSKETGIKVYPHRFRYTYASRLIAHGFSPALVQSWLGHSTAKLTLEVYTQAMLEKEILRWLGS